MEVLVTGHSGFVGNHLLRKLKNHPTIVTPKKFDNKRIDILNKDQLFDLQRVDTVVHLAAKTSIPNSFSMPYDTYYTNFVGTLNILDYALRKKIKNIINVSTYVYGEPQYIPIDENHPTNPHTPYNKSKLLSEKLCEHYSEDFGINIVTLRPFSIYGPANNSSFIPTVVRKLFRREKVILSKKNTRRDFLYVDDFCTLVYRILLDFPDGYHIYNVGFGRSYSLEDIVEKISLLTHENIDIQYDPSLRPNDISEMVADIDKVKKKFDWTPVTKIEEGLQLTINNLVDQH
ncbi:MAG TPA: NAD-dependent epimerase/dehydratase family protein [Candidatus Nitrosocosmicus sp.]|nr:NAD-dependent epimerase/dehydratase family protein [Candidatus Nitrosocosmicus sp.]